MAKDEIFNETESQMLNKIKLNVKEYDELYRKGLDLIKKMPNSQELLISILEEYEERLDELPPIDIQVENLENFDEKLKEKIKALILFGTQAALLNENAKMHHQLRVINQKYKDLISVVTHEFKNALTSIYGYNRILKKRVENQDYDRLLPMIENIDRLTKNLFTMVDTLLNMSLIEEGKLSLNRQIFDFVEDVITPLINEFEPQLKEKNQKIVLKKSDKILYNGDLHLLQVVFRNLIMNALQYGDEDSEIEIDFNKGKESLEIYFLNYGMGVQKEQIPHLFEKFSRFTKLQGRHNVGIGLYTVKNIIELHGGKITVESNPGEWIKFIITLPLTLQRMEAQNG